MHIDIAVCIPRQGLRNRKMNNKLYLKSCVSKLSVSSLQSIEQQSIQPFTIFYWTHTYSYISIHSPTLPYEILAATPLAFEGRWMGNNDLPFFLF